jgi:regulator of replication initiation timing
LSFGCVEIGARAASDKTVLKTQVDDLVAENTSLKLKAEGLAADVAQLKSDQAKAQELFDKRQAEAGSREKNLQQHLQTALDSSCGKPHSMFNLGFVRIASVC